LRRKMINTTEPAADQQNMGTMGGVIYVGNLGGELPQLCPTW